MSSYELTRLANAAKTVINPATEEKQDDITTAITSLEAAVDLLAKLTDTQPVSAASLPLPTGAATEAKQDDNLTSLASIFAAMLTQAQVDTTSTAVKSIENAHAKLHEGRNFTVSIDTTGTSLIVAWKVKAGQTVHPHVTLHWKTENTGTITFYKGATWTTNTGSALTPSNSNDNYHGIITSVLQGDSTGSFVDNSLVQNPTELSTASARVLYTESVWATNQAPAPSGSSRQERVGESDETYAVVITATSGGIWFYMDWYEPVAAS